MKIKGLYIEDDPDNITSYGRYFEDEDIEIIATETLHDSADDYYDLVCKNNVDFVIIDNHLDKSGVNYDGFEVLKAIRKQDSTIYLILLTNFNYSDRTFDELSKFDQTVLKEEFGKNFKGIINRIKRAHSRRNSNNVVEEIDKLYEHNSLKMDGGIEELKKLNKNINILIKRNNNDN